MLAVEYRNAAGRCAVRVPLWEQLPELTHQGTHFTPLTTYLKKWVNTVTLKELKDISTMIPLVFTSLVWGRPIGFQRAGVRRVQGSPLPFFSTCPFLSVFEPPWGSPEPVPLCREQHKVVLPC